MAAALIVLALIGLPATIIIASYGENHGYRFAHLFWIGALIPLGWVAVLLVVKLSNRPRTRPKQPTRLGRAL